VHHDDAAAEFVPQPRPPARDISVRTSSRRGGVAPFALMIQQAPRMDWKSAYAVLNDTRYVPSIFPLHLFF